MSSIGAAPDKEIFELSERMGEGKDSGDLIEIGSKRHLLPNKNTTDQQSN